RSRPTPSASSTFSSACMPSTTARRQPGSGMRCVTRRRNACWCESALNASRAGTTGSSAARTDALEEARQLREPFHPLGRDERQLAAELLAVEKDLRRLLEHHGARRGVTHRLPDRHEPVALEDRAAARLERLADGLGELRRARHEPRYGPRV